MSQRKPITLKLESGESLAIQGKQGSGKSNLLQSLCGSHQIAKGVIRLDGLDVRMIHSRALREQLVYVNTGGFLPLTILENLTYGREEFSLEQVKQSLEQVGLLKVLESHREGLFLKVNSHGFPLSPGQRIQLALARCLLFQPKIIVIDQGFDFISDELRNKLLKTLLDKNQKWTVISTTMHDEVAKHFSKILNLDRYHSSAIERVA